MDQLLDAGRLCAVGIGRKPPACCGDVGEEFDRHAASVAKSIAEISGGPVFQKN
ncbi:hypothetical protein [Bradyrhizobium sp. 157]|uniref:hypothetical protein n=1 Tax=Bradyrhizobium sp. 157 TaxID=2782631 RepID=UPI001FFA3332